MVFIKLSNYHTLKIITNILFVNLQNILQITNVVYQVIKLLLLQDAIIVFKNIFTEHIVIKLSHFQNESQKCDIQQCVH